MNRELASLAIENWNHTFGLGMSDDEADAVFRDILAPHGLPEAEREMRVLQHASLAKVADGAFTTLTASHSFLAACALSDVSEAAYGDEVQLPYPAFWVEFPDRFFGDEPKLDFGGCIVAFRGLPQDERERLTAAVSPDFTEDEQERVARYIARTQGASAIFLLSRKGMDFVSDVAPNLFDLLFKPTPQRMAPDSPQPVETSEMRAMEVARRVVVGLLHAWQYTSNFQVRERAQRPWLRPGVRQPPLHRTVVFGTPIEIQAHARAYRDAVHAAVRGEAPQAFQRLVRGHYKRQVVGIGRSGRKVIWVQPYWRGPEEAPILARAMKVG